MNRAGFFPKALYAAFTGVFSGAFSAAWILACSSSAVAQPAQDTLYINLNTHCEEMDKDPAGATLDYSKNQAQYTQYRAYVKQIADLVRSKGAKWNYQSDWNFLLAAQQFDKGDAATNGKNLLRWMAEDNNGQIQLDPHAHQNQYNYADVAYLLDQLSPTIKSSKNVGGFTWNGPMGAQTLMGMTTQGFTWDTLAKGLRGRKYTTYTWRAEVLLGGASYDYRRMQTSHGNDLNHLGAWRPRDTTSVGYMTHTCGAALANLGVGGDALLQETTSVATDVATVMEIVRTTLATMRQTANRGKFFTMQIQTNQRDFSRAGYMDKISALLDSLRPFAALGQIKWATHTEKFTTWKSLYKEKPNFYPLNGSDLCSATMTSVNASNHQLANQSTNQTSNERVLSVAPNPANEQFTVSINLLRAEYVRLVVCDALGRELARVFEGNMNAGLHTIPVSVSMLASAPASLVFVRLQTNTFPAFSHTQPVQVTR